VARLGKDGRVQPERGFPPQVIFVNGASSAGKTSLIKAVQEQATVPYLHVGLDHCFATVPAPLGSTGRARAEGFAYRPSVSLSDGLPRTEIAYGETGAAILRAYRRSLVTLLEQGCRLAIDELLLGAEIGADYVRLLEPFDTRYVLMTAGADCLEARCAARGYSPGFGRWSMAAGANLPRPYDAEFSSETSDSAALAAELTGSWARR
jgi:chloramphenicol 3-O phosphotransferase